MILDAMEARRWLDRALRERFAILAVNADSPAAMTDCLEAALRCRAPIMIETSLWQLKGWSFGAGDAMTGMTRYLADLSALADAPRYRKVPVFFHTDHIKGRETLPLLTQAIRGLSVRMGSTDVQLRPSTVSLDSSEMTETENIDAMVTLARTAEESRWPLVLEMEAGVDQGLTPLDITERMITGVEKRTPGHLGLWAPGVGTHHGFSDQGYPAFSTAAIQAQQTLATQLCGRPIGIALHGSSGLSESHLQEGVQAGVVKVNWSSESLWIRSQAAREFYETKRAQLEKRHPEFKNHAMDNGVQSFVSEQYIPKVIDRIRVLGAEGKVES